MEPVIRGLAVVLLGIGLLGLLVMLLAPSRNCPNCRQPLPRLRMPRSFRELLWGGWHCPVCSTLVSRTGQFLD